MTRKSFENIQCNDILNAHSILDFMIYLYTDFMSFGGPRNTGMFCAQTPLKIHGISPHGSGDNAYTQGIYLGAKTTFLPLSKLKVALFFLYEILFKQCHEVTLYYVYESKFIKIKLYEISITT